MPKAPGHYFGSDKPLEELEDDELGYAEFAASIAHLVETMPPQGLVVAIRGDWGIGKSTVLNFIAKQLCQDPPPIVFPFNPWWFSGREDLTRQFLMELRQKLGGIVFKAAAILEKERFLCRVDTLFDLLSICPDPRIAVPAKVLKLLRNFISVEKRDIHRLKKRISAELRKKRQRIVVLVDDIDRLTRDEIRELFAVVRSIADFPYTYYFLAFDWRVVVKALSGIQGEGGVKREGEADYEAGENYLEKIVQLPTAVPPPLKTALHELYRRRLGSTLEQARPELREDDIRYSEIKGRILDFIDTPRDAVRLANSVLTFYEEIKDEAFPVEYEAAQALNVFSPLAFDTIARRSDKFERQIGTIEGSLKQELVAFHSRWLRDVPEEVRGRVVSLLGAMYPHLEPVLREIQNGVS